MQSGLNQGSATNDNNVAVTAGVIERPVAQLTLFSSHNALRIGMVILSLIPILLVIYIIHTFFVDVPFTDAWETWIGRAWSEQYGSFEQILESRWSLRNDSHRQFFPQMLMLGYLQIAPLSMLPTMYFSVLLLSGTGFLIFNAYKRYSNGLSAYAVLILVSMLIFTPVAEIRWLNPNLFIIVLAVIQSVFAFWLLTHPETSGRKFAVALLSSALAAMTFGTGNITLILGGVTLLLTPYRRWRYLLPWATVSGALVGSYLLDRFQAQVAHDIPSGLPNVLSLGHYSITLLGAPLTGNELDAATVIGLLGVIGFTCVSAALLFKGASIIKKLLFWWLLAGWTLLNAGQIAFGRIAFQDVGGAVLQRYFIYGSLFWIVLIVLSLILMNEHVTRRTRRFLVLIPVSIIALHILTSVDVLQDNNLHSFSNRLQASVDCIRDHEFRQPCVYRVTHQQISFLQARLPYAYRYRATFLDLSKARPDNIYSFYLPAEETDLYQTITIDDRSYSAIEQRDGQRLRWRYPSHLSDMSFDLGLWIAPTPDNGNNDQVTFKVTLVSQTSSSDELVRETFDYVLSEQQPIQWLHLTEPRLDVEWVTLILMVETGESGEIDEDDAPHSYWIEPQVTIKPVSDAALE